MFKFRKVPRDALNDLEAYLRDVGDEPARWLAREVQSWNEFSYADIEAAILSGRGADLVDWQARYAAVVNEKFNPLWLAAIAQASHVATGGRITIDDSDVRVKEFLRQRAAELVTQLSAESKRAVANVILFGQSEHLAPRDIAKLVRPLIGLNARQAEANAVYRRRLFERLTGQGLSATTANQRAEAAAVRYASKQHRQRAETIVHTELSRAYNRGAFDGVRAAQRAGLMNVCEMIWSTAGTNRVCGRCLSLKDSVVGHTDEAGVQLPPLHPRCRCVIHYREVKPQRFGVQRLPEGNYNLTLRRQVQSRHIEGTKEYQDYVTKLSEKNLMPSKLSSNVDAQALVKEFHGKGIYDPNPKDDSPREQVDTGRIVGRYWDNATRKYVDTAWIEIVYSKRGAHIYPIRPPQED